MFRVLTTSLALGILLRLRGDDALALKDQAVFGSYVGGSMTDLESKLGEPLVVVNQFFNWGDSIKSFISGLGSRVPLATLEPWNYSLSQISSGAADSWLTQVKN